jgi:hypothetical protein
MLTKSPSACQVRGADVKQAFGPSIDLLSSFVDNDRLCERRMSKGKLCDCRVAR